MDLVAAELTLDLAQTIELCLHLGHFRGCEGVSNDEKAILVQRPALFLSQGEVGQTDARKRLFGST